MTAHSIFSTTRFRSALWLSGMLAVVILAPACSNGVGANCEISQDCASGLTCCTASCATPARGTCQASCDGVVCTTDAATSEADAFSSGDAFSPGEPDASTTSEPDAASDVDGGT